MKVPGRLIFLLVAQIVFVNCKPQSRSTFSCAVGINYVSTPHEFFANNIEENVKFHLYTNEKPDGEEISLNMNDFEASSFNCDRPTVMITHGYFNNKESNACVVPRDAFLRNKNYNVIVVDWSKMESVMGVPVVYNTACKMVPIVAYYVAKMIKFLEIYGMKTNETTLVGHSLGAHLMGIAANRTQSRISYIIGLDPAAPNFEDKDPFERLSPDDANTVLVIHTNEGDCGMSQPIGHFDFYPNGGKKQPGCVMNVCAHSRAVDYYAESIYSKDGFYGNWCSDLDSALNGRCDGYKVKMDEKMRINNAKEGFYHFTTGTDSPFALGNESFNLDHK